MRRYGQRSGLVARDDLALAAVRFRGINRTADTPPRQESGTPCANGITSPAPRRGLARVIGELRKGEQVAPCLPSAGDLVIVRADAKRNRQRRIAMQEDYLPPIGSIAQSNPAKFADAHI